MTTTYSNDSPLSRSRFVRATTRTSASLLSLPGAVLGAVLHPGDTLVAVSERALTAGQDVLIKVGEVGLGLDVVKGVAERGIIAMMKQNITTGQLTLITPSATYLFPTNPRPTSPSSAASGSPSPTYRDFPSQLASSRSTAPSSPPSSSRPDSPSQASTPLTSLSLASNGSRFAPKLGARATIRVTSDRFWLRLLTLGDLGFAEAYMAGECEVYRTRADGELVEDMGEGLLDIFKIFIHSKSVPDLPKSHMTARRSISSASAAASTTVGGLTTLPSALFMKIASYAADSRVVNSVRNSVGNIRAHYDISNRMFASFLSKDMTYSSAIFPELDADLTGSDSSPRWPGDGDYDASVASARETIPDDQDPLEQAQLAKLRHIIRKAKIRKGDRVLEIGSGWGSFAMEAVRMTGCTVDTLTLSEQQKVLAEERIKAAGLEKSITVHLMDFRNTPEEWTHSFDRLVSIEMLEAVGKDYIEPYFDMIDKMLNEEGVAVFQVITIPEGRFESYQKSTDFIRKWIFPGGFLPSVAFVSDCVQKGGHNRLIIDSVVNIGPHYARTLREWRKRFLTNFDRDIIPALRDEHPEMTEEDIQVFKRKWIYYFVYCEIGFHERVLGDHIFCLTREGNSAFGSDVYA